MEMKPVLSILKYYPSPVSLPSLSVASQDSMVTSLGQKARWCKNPEEMLITSWCQQAGNMKSKRQLERN